jgi:hypothetical protein
MRKPLRSSRASEDFDAPATPDQASLFELWRFHALFTTSFFLINGRTLALR